MREERAGRDFGLDLVRVAATVIVICGHYSFALGRRGEEGFTNYLAFFPNGEWPLAAVTMFLALSGAVLWPRYHGCTHWAAFYQKRWRSLFPPFYLAWLGAAFAQTCRTGRVFWGGHPAKLLLTAIGMDNYLAYRIPGYGLVGEWFFGAIVLLYLLFPALCRCFGRHPLLTLAAAGAGYTVLLFWYPLQIDPHRNLVTCLFTFLLGCCIGRWPALRSPAVAGAAACGVLVLAKVPLHLPSPLGDTLTGMCLLLALQGLGGLLGRRAAVRRAVTWLSGRTFPMILVHHVLATALAANIPGPFTVLRGSLFLALTLAGSLGFGLALETCSGRLMEAAGRWARKKREERA